MAKRRVYRLQWNRKEEKWSLTGPGFKEYADYDWTKKEFLSWSRWYARFQAPSQLVVYGKSGKILFEATYGQDPERYKG